MPSIGHGTAQEGVGRGRSDGWRIVNSIHDEIVAEGRTPAEESAAIVQQVMEAAGNQLVPAVPIAAEGGVANTWAEK